MGRDRPKTALIHSLLPRDSDISKRCHHLALLLLGVRLSPQPIPIPSTPYPVAPTATTGVHWCTTRSTRSFRFPNPTLEVEPGACITGVLTRDITPTCGTFRIQGLEACSRSQIMLVELIGLFLEPGYAVGYACQQGHRHMRLLISETLQALVP